MSTQSSAQSSTLSTSSYFGLSSSKKSNSLKNEAINVPPFDHCGGQTDQGVEAYQAQDGWEIGVCWARNARPYQEDCWFITSSLPLRRTIPPSSSSSSSSSKAHPPGPPPRNFLPYTSWGVFDGHGGSSCSDYCHKEYPSVLRSSLPPSPSPSPQADSLSRSLRSSLVAIAVLFSTSLPPNTLSSPGSTANIVLSSSPHLLCGNVGDSSSHYYPPNTSSPHGDKLSVDHDTWVRSDEHTRLLASGAFLHPSPPPFNLGSVFLVKALYAMAFGCPRVYKPDMVGGVVGGLNMTRSVGDVHLKPQVSHEPDVEVRGVGREVGGYVVTATDGVWDELGPGEVRRLIEEAEMSLGTKGDELPKCEGVARAASMIVREAIRRGGRDNATAIVAKRCIPK
ncbi:hypothetical protein TrCOL_g13051 [Triparma columacea]|uniref:PPM-type phosphatase domain-containing protein n=1 Tax=Triparma columacea TaxID=722753 RepID=A0A9W7G0P9_9STRA|nr:hypothetical protein TrCOL_g13051 [Triparma columacea]